MISTKLDTYNLPRLTPRFIQGKLRTTTHELHKFIKAKMRRARSVSRATIRRQYFITNAASDLRTAVKNNEDIVIGTSVLSAVLGFAAIVASTHLLFSVFETTYGVAIATGMNMGLLVAMTVLELLLLGSWLGTFILNMLSISCMQGLMPHIKRSVRITIQQGLRQASRVASVWYALLAILGTPIALIAIACLTYLRISHAAIMQALYIAPFIVIAAIAWVMFVVMLYGLAPYVALFETNLTLRDTFVRSQQLVKRRGHIFLLAIYGAVIAISYGIFKLSSPVSHLLKIDRTLLCAAGIILCLATANCLMVMFYRKRKLARKY